MQHILDVCNSAASYVNRSTPQYNAFVKTVILTPEGDPIVDKYKNQALIYEGSDKDVLSRYVKAAETEEAEYVVRVTSDCVFMASHVISRCIKSALIKEMDYVTNTLVRTFIEGQDVEVVSAKLLKWLDENATEAYDREHVTSYAVKKFYEKKFPFSRCDGRPSVHHILNEFDFSSYKTSIDTKEEYDRAVQLFSDMRRKRNEATGSGII